MKDENCVPYPELPGEGNEKAGEDLSPADAGQGNEEAKDEETVGAQEFEQLIKGKYADPFARKVQRIIDKRFRHTRLLEAQVKENEEFMKRLAVLCEGDSSKPEELYRLIEERTVSGRKASDIDAPMRERMTERAKKAYPGFDPDICFEDPEFCAFVEMGLDFGQAYALTHLESIREDSLKEGARRALLSLSTMGKRPVEGELSQSAPANRRGVASLSGSEVRKLMERAAKGEKIKFKDI